jgi:hypothetical protein
LSRHKAGTNLSTAQAVTKHLRVQKKKAVAVLISVLSALEGATNLLTDEAVINGWSTIDYDFSSSNGSMGLLLYVPFHFQFIFTLHINSMSKKFLSSPTSH